MNPSRAFDMALGAVAMIGIVLLVARCDGLDDTDPPGGHSGVVPRVDHATGCQYLSRGNSLIPRTDENGRHRGCGEKR